MKKEKAGKRFRLSLIISILVSILLLTVLIGWAVLKRNFETVLPEHFFDDISTDASPRFFVYDFSDRKNREGTPIDVTADVYSKEETRQATPEELPDRLLQAFIAVEDKRFWKHDGVDWYRTLAAGANYLIQGSNGFGASTITQQTVKNLTGNDERTVHRKVQEMFYATDLERKVSKREILSMYLNAVSFSDNCEGIIAASSHYFGKVPSELTLAECASLAATVQSPTYYNPAKNPEHNKERRNVVLNLMCEQGYIGEAERDEAIQTDVITVASSERGNPIRSWYIDTVITDVVHDLMERYGLSEKEAYLKLTRGGLRIEMAMDPTLQKQLEEYYANEVRLPGNEKGESAQSALVLMDARTGDLLAVIGGAGEKNANLIQNFATGAKRSPGSAIKPLTVYSAGLEEGKITWASVFDDVPVTFGESEKSPWPRNANRVYRGLTDIPYAVAHSTNTVAVRVLQEVGTKTSYQYAKKFHLTNLCEEDQNTVALALGQLQDGLTLREITAAYSVFPNGGVYHPCRSYYRVTDANGKILLCNGDVSERVLSEGNAAVMTKLLQGVVREGTSSSLTVDSLTECAGKTGTTSDDRDRWFIGFTPDLICGVWCGYPYPEPLVGKNLCTGIWNGAMEKVLSVSSGKIRFDVPENLVEATYCRDSGCLCTGVCSCDPRGSRQSVGWFVEGTQPRTNCSCHQLVICDTEGGILHGETDPAYQKEVALISVERHFPTEVFVTDAQYVYRGDPNLMEANQNQTESYFQSSINDFCGTSGVEVPFNRSCLIDRTPILPEPNELRSREDENPNWWFSIWHLLFRKRNRI